MARSSRDAFREKLAFYAIGVAIGMVMLGLIYGMRQRAVRNSAPPQDQPPARAVTGPTTPASASGTAGSPPGR